MILTLVIYLIPFEGVDKHSLSDSLMEKERKNDLAIEIVWGKDESIVIVTNRSMSTKATTTYSLKLGHGN